MRGPAPDETCPDHFAELYRHTDAELARWRFFSGHFRMDELRRIPPPAFRVTLLRDPRERILSLYRFWRRIGLSFPSPPPGPRAARETDLADFLRCRVPDVAEAVDNAVARGLAGGVFVRPGQGWVFAAPDGNGQPPAGPRSRRPPATGCWGSTWSASPGGWSPPTPRSPPISACRPRRRP